GMTREELRAGLKPGVKPDLRVEQQMFGVLIPLIEDVAGEKEILRLKGFKVALSTVNEDAKGKIVSLLEKDGFQPPSKSELSEKLTISDREINDLLIILTKEGSLVKINDMIYLGRGQYDKMIALLKGFFSSRQEMTVAEFRDILGTTRKYALPFLEYLDSKRVTLRVGDVRRFMLK
ncbi:MAG: SelB C-terminal domain-containing protein, partial [Nitrospirae bacterium]|nr:SelB C-terminal domain-containing protein [Nitrospirota bacterium]